MAKSEKVREQRDVTPPKAAAAKKTGTQKKADKKAAPKKASSTAKTAETSTSATSPAPKAAAPTKDTPTASAGTTTRAKTKATAKKATTKKAATTSAQKPVSKAKKSTKTTKRASAVKGAEGAQRSAAGLDVSEAVEVLASVGKDKATKKETKKHKALESDFTSALKVGEGFSLSDVDASSTPAFDAGPKKAEKLMRKTGEELADLQERLYAGQRHAGGKSVLLLVQGMDTSGKGGIMRHVVGTLDPQGVELTSFKAPTKLEQEHPFLWRIRNALPKPGYVGVFDRSQYEDVLIVRVHDLVSRPVWMRRYGQINAFEKSVVAKGTTIIKVMLYVDADEQKARLAERLENPEKFYKFNPGDLKEREYWADYLEAYQAVLDRTSTDYAPWFVVPANNKWYARLAVQQLLLEHLRALDLQWPEATFDIEAQKKALAAL